MRPDGWTSEPRQGGAASLVLAFALLLFATTNACGDTPAVAEAPTFELPAGWVYIPMEVIDAAEGAFHDEVSGLIVRSEVAPFQIAAHRGERALSEGGVQHRETIKSMDVVLVKRKNEECEDVSAIVYLQRNTGALWSLDAHVCEPRGLDRMKTLIREVARPELYNALPDSPAPFTRIGETALGEIRVGMRWGEIRQLGLPHTVAATSDGGLVLTYFDGRAGRRGEKLHLFLSRERSLIRWEPEDLTYGVP